MGKNRLKQLINGMFLKKLFLSLLIASSFLSSEGNYYSRLTGD